MERKKNKTEGFACVFPVMDYHTEMERLAVTAISPVMVSFVRERAAYEPDMAGIFSLDDLERDILSLASAPEAMDRNLQEVFHKVQIWGGEHGRYIYVQGPAFDWLEIGPPYRRLVKACLEDGRSYGSLVRKAKAFNTAMQDQGRRLGMSFITKHMHFWSAAIRGDDALPIFDRIMASGLHLRPKWEHLEVYWHGMEDKALKEGISISALERQLFNRFRKEGKGF